MAVSNRLESSRFPSLPLCLDVRGRSHAVEALIDTVFDGDIAVPVDLLANGEPDDHHRWTLADGSDVYAPYYIGVVHVGDVGSLEAVITGLGEEAIVGRGVTDRYRVILDHGQRIVIEP